MQPVSDPPAEASAHPRDALLAALRLQAEWGADEALDTRPIDRLRVAAQIAAQIAAQVAPEFVAPLAAPAGPDAVHRSLRNGAVPAPSAAAPAGSAADLPALLVAWAGFGGCALRHTAASTVLPAGDSAAPLLLVGEAPDADDDRAGAAYAGAAGKYLDRMLGSIGLTRAGVRFAFLSPWRPPGGRQLSESELRACLPFLQRYIALAPPKFLVLLGSLPLRALTGSSDSIRRGRGRWRDAAVPGLERTVPSLATFPPAQVAGNPALRRDAWADLLLLRRTLDGDAGPVRPVT